ncbi:ER degradation-enhancing alpha-mannosidase-like protein 2 [Toxocara canis]|uniref:alpha-1,2-Mannosidase n=1 Tax=Toxocara canis TaxID=6265 RepID=A0A0B2W577_TOXCA|nr:ER degradation-enhancing alpha-mannosidase-like protein 2 [Toxocara canis]
MSRRTMSHMPRFRVTTRTAGMVEFELPLEYAKRETVALIVFKMSVRDKVKSMFYHAYDSYLKYAFPLDELKPISCSGMDTWGGFSLSLIDSLDTLLIMGNETEFIRAASIVVNSTKVDANVNVSVFETNIRVVGGLLTAHFLSGRVTGMKKEAGWPCSGPLLRLAERFAQKLLPAFNTDTGMPYGTVNLRYGVHRYETPITCTAGVGTMILEFGTLSRITGEHFTFFLRPDNICPSHR